MSLVSKLKRKRWFWSPVGLFAMAALVFAFRRQRLQRTRAHEITRGAHCVEMTLSANGLNSVDELPSSLSLDFLCDFSHARSSLLPHPATMTFGNYYWQFFKTTAQEEVYLYSAYYDDRKTLDEPAVRVLTMINRHEKMDTRLNCLIWYDADQYLEVRADLVAMKVGAPLLKSNLLNAFFVSCKTAPSERVPKAVSLLEAGSEAGISNVLHLRDNRPSQRGVGQLALCLKPAWFEGRDYALRLAEWFELQFILGIEKVFVAPFYLDKHSKNLLEHYQRLGKIEILAPFSFASTERITLSDQNATEESNIQARGPYEMLSHTDCLYRNIHRFKYLALLDSDEVFLPLKADSLTELLHHVDNKQRSKWPKVATDFSFRQYHFLHQMMNPKDIKNKPTHEYMSSHTMRSKDTVLREEIQNKAVIRVSTAVTVWAHRTWLNLPMLERGGGVSSGREGYGGVTVPPDLALMAHYRKWCRDDIYSEEECAEEIAAAVRDDSIARFSPRLRERTLATLENIGMM